MIDIRIIFLTHPILPKFDIKVKSYDLCSKELLQWDTTHKTMIVLLCTTVKWSSLKKPQHLKVDQYSFLQWEVTINTLWNDNPRHNCESHNCFWFNHQTYKPRYDCRQIPWSYQGSYDHIQIDIIYFQPQEKLMIICWSHDPGKVPYVPPNSF